MNSKENICKGGGEKLPPLIQMPCELSDHVVGWKNQKSLVLLSELYFQATHYGKAVIFKGELREISEGQLFVSMKRLSTKVRVPVAEIRSFLKRLENERWIEQEVTRGTRIITLNDFYFTDGTVRSREDLIMTEMKEKGCKREAPIKSRVEPSADNEETIIQQWN